MSGADGVLCCGFALLGWYPLLVLIWPIWQRVRLWLIYQLERDAEKRKGKR